MKVLTYRLTGVDPGTSNIGFACLFIDSVTLKLVKIETTNIDVSKSDKVKGVRYDAKVEMRLSSLSKALEYLYLHYRPIACACETVYIDRFRPASVSPLAKAVRTIKSTFRSVVNGYMRDVNPMSAKKLIKVIRPKRIKGVKIDQKQLVTDALKRSNVAKYMERDIDDLTEHEQDAIILTLVLYNDFLTREGLQMQLLTDVDLGEFTDMYTYRKPIDSLIIK